MTDERTKQKNCDTLEFEFVCSNKECFPKRYVKDGYVQLSDRSYYALSEEAEANWLAGRHPGCIRCGAPLEHRFGYVEATADDMRSLEEARNEIEQNIG